SALLRACAARGLRAVGMKPVAAGIEPGAVVNADVAALAAAGNVDAPLADRNPYAFSDAVAPHLAAARAGVTIGLAPITAAYARLAARADVVVVEGAGGALVPLGTGTDVLDVPRALGLPVLLVVGLRLGCLNHARLSVLAIRARGLALAGWIACRIDPAMALADENREWLARELPAPLIADLAAPGILDAGALARLGIA
ncbi:MAG: dethiobiotin synthase, partial [Betaproteobacteria bacterium]|nr:dethiobiotin synthase [Betaproteobacteria bacterium]